MKKQLHDRNLTREELEKREYLFLQEIEQIYGVPSETVRKWIKRDGSDGIPPLKAFKPGREIMIQKKTFELYIQRFAAA